MTQANKGKQAEHKLQVAFTAYASNHSEFDYERIQDARSSMGKMSVPRAGDFLLFHKGKNILLEVKEVAHDYRLPKPNFDRGQRARMKKRQYAGSICYVIVYHSTTEIWRLLPLDYFGVEETGSWDLITVPPLNLKQLMENIICLSS